MPASHGHHQELCSVCEKNRPFLMCVSCFAQEIFFWVHEQEIPVVCKKQIKDGLDALVGFFQSMKTSVSPCIFCFRYVESVCKQCLIEKARSVLQEFPFQESRRTYILNKS